MSKLLVCIGLVSVFSSSTFAQAFTDAGYVPPPASKAALDATLNPLPKSQVARYVGQISNVHTFNQLQGQNEALQAEASESKEFIVGRGYAVNMSSSDLFTTGYVDGPYTVYTAAISSVDAYGLRLVVDLSQLKSGEDAWVVDLNGPRAFGPYTAADQSEGGRWLPTTQGESAMLMVRTTGSGIPQIQLKTICHFFRSFDDAVKVLSCNINIECESNADLQSISTGVGMMVVPNNGSDAELCSGSLVNNSDTPEFEPYFLTSYHCVPSIAAATQIDVIWDWRSTDCATYTPPALSSMPRSNGLRQLAYSGTYDESLIQLDSVPDGTNGRSYLGWDTRDPVVTESIDTIHYPAGTAERINYGTVIGINEAFNSFANETNVHWDSGVTEGGSSGSPLLLVSSSFRLCGTLSGGPTHSCASNTGNVDWYSPFRKFFPQIQGYLQGTTPPDPGGGSKSCAAAKAFANNPKVLEDLRALRDDGLMQTTAGKWLVSEYYKVTPTLSAYVDSSPTARAIFEITAAPFAAIGGMMH